MLLGNASGERVLGLGEILRLGGGDGLSLLGRRLPELVDARDNALILFAQLALPLTQLLDFGLAAHEIAAIEGLDLEAGFELGPHERLGKRRPRT